MSVYAHAYLRYKTSALALNLHQDVCFPDGKRRNARMIRHPALKLGGTGQGALCTHRGVLHNPFSARSVENVLQFVDRLLRRVLGVHSGVDGDLGDERRVVIQPVHPSVIACARSSLEMVSPTLALDSTLANRLGVGVREDDRLQVFLAWREV